MYILGLTTMGDSAACLIRDGAVIAAAEEERFSRVKHHVGVPYESIRYLLEEAGITIDDIDHVALYWKPWILRRRVMVGIKSLATSWDAFEARRKRGMEQVGGHYRRMFHMKSHLKKTFGGGKFDFHYVEHHIAHAASAFFVSPHDSAAILCVDGTGEDTTVLFAHGKGNHIEPLHRVHLPHSLGQFYSAITNFLGFDMRGGDEWKVMGLAGWGEPEFYDYFVKNIIIPKGRNSFTFDSKLLDHHLAKTYQFNPEFMKVVGPNRKPDEELSMKHRNVAASAQKATEEIVLKMLEWLHEKTGEKNLCMAGGVAFNSLMNGRIVRDSPFENVYFQPAAGDAGCSLGAASYIWHQKLGNTRSFVMDHAYWGPSYSDDECEKVLKEMGVKYERMSDEELAPRVAGILAEGNIVAWFHGRMEWGPRALGRRSFLADPRDADMREKLNHQVKLREWFRPLAPSMLAERSEMIFGKKHYDPFMMTVFPVADGMRELIPAVVHVDGTARPQTVRREVNPRYWDLISEFEKLTGVPCLLNTSFNIQEPIVCTPADAVRTFQTSQVKHLVVERFLVTK